MLMVDNLKERLDLKDVDFPDIDVIRNKKAQEEEAKKAKEARDKKLVERKKAEDEKVVAELEKAPKPEIVNDNTSLYVAGAAGVGLAALVIYFVSGKG